MDDTVGHAVKLSIDEGNGIYVGRFQTRLGPCQLSKFKPRKSCGSSLSQLDSETSGAVAEVGASNVWSKASNEFQKEL